MGKGLALAATAVAAVCVAASAGAREASDPPLLIGANYAHFSLAGCDLSNHGVVHDGATHQTLISAELQAMRLAGIQSLRMIVWNMHDATGQQWGIVDSAGGRMPSRYAESFVQFLKLVRSYGFAQLSIAFGPEWANDPVNSSNPWDPALFDENWHFVQYVRALVKKYGPHSTHFDLINEAAPSDYWSTKSRVESYVAQMWTNYVEAYGNSDATVSTILDTGDMSTLGNLVDTLEATGEPMPLWYEVHSYTSHPLQDLQAADSLLTSKGVDAPLVLGETFYDDAQVAAAVNTYVSGTTRPLLEAMSWPLQRGSDCSGVSPPYRAHELYTALTGADPATPPLVANVGDTVSMNVEGRPLVGLEAGTYSITVNDNAPGATFRLMGSGVSRVVRAPGVYHWTVNLAPGLYVYLRNGHGQSFRVF